MRVSLHGEFMDLLHGAKEEGNFCLQLFSLRAGTLCELAEVATVARTPSGPETPCTRGHSPSVPVSLGVRLLLHLQTCPQLRSRMLGLGRE